MPKFRVKCINPDGKVTQMVITADNENVCGAMVKMMGIFPQEMELVKDPEGSLYDVSKSKVKK